jgi:hypothetical protein
MPDLTTPAGRDESRRKLGWCKQLGIESIDEVPVGDLLALLDQADAGAALAQRVIRAARLLGIANSDTEPNAAETQMLVDDILTHCANLADAGERDRETLKAIAELVQDLCQRFPLVRQVLEQVTGVTIPPPARAAAEDDTCHCGLGPEDHKLGGAAEHNYVPRAAAEETK